MRKKESLAFKQIKKGLMDAIKGNIPRITTFTIPVKES